MSTTSLQTIVNGTPIGDIVEEAGEYIFSYAKNIRPEDCVSLTMPVRARDYTSTHLHPIFEMHLPEGYLLSVIKKQFAKLTNTDDFGLLRILAPSISGRIQYKSTVTEQEQSLSLEELLHSENPALFDELVSRFAIRSALSGVQPKVLATLENKATLQFADYIIKAWGQEYPELALNEYCCMLACQYAGIPVPEFYLSDDESLFVMKRFDILDNARVLGFEDMCVLQAKQRDDKYTGSYEGVAKTIKTFASPQHKVSSLEQFYKMIVLNNLLQNGDAHLKNFGMLYSTTSSIQLAPVYDVVSTTAYIKNDISALTLLGSKKWWTREYLEKFGTQACELSPIRANVLYQICIEALRKVAIYVQDRITAKPSAQKLVILEHLQQLVNVK